MERNVEKRIDKFLKEYNLKKLKTKYVFEAPESRKEMVGIFQKDYEKNRALTKKTLIKLLNWAFYNDRRFLGIFKKYLKNEKESKIKEITKKGLKLAEQNKIKKAIRKLTEIKGIGNVTASKILMFTFPNNFGMYDQFNGKAIYNLKINNKNYFKKPDPNDLTDKQYSKEYEKYIKIIRKISKKINLKPIEVDQALFRLGRKH